jgi:hypothetical protein
MVHGAIYDAVQAITGEFPQYLRSLTAPEGASAEAATASAARDVLVRLYPSQRSTIEAAYAASLTKIAEGDGKRLGVDVGHRAAAAMLAARATDHSSDVVSYAPDHSLGHWQPTPPLSKPALEPGWLHVKPFTLQSPAQFRAPLPYALTSRAYAADFNEVKALGAASSTSRTEAQTAVAKFWAVTSPQVWNQAARQLAAHMSLSKASRLFAMLNVAEADAAIATWDTKFTYNQWRPVTAIHAAANDGNPATTADPKWLPLLPTPAFPDYVCGHSTLGGAAETVFESFFGPRPGAEIKLTSAAVPGVVHHFTTFRAIEDEVINARVWGGIHWRTSCVVGRTIGNHIGAWTTKHFGEV